MGAVAKIGIRSLNLRRGQAVLEYVLMLSLLSVLTAGFVRFFTVEVFRAGLADLPGKVSACVSHPGRNQANRCD